MGWAQIGQRVVNGDDVGKKGLVNGDDVGKKGLVQCRGFFEYCYPAIWVEVIR